MRLTRAARRLGLAGVALGAGACALVEGLGNLERVNDVAPPPDGGSAGDGASPIEGGAAGEAGDAGPPTFCSTRPRAPFFCDDFDVYGLPGKWASFHQTGGSLAEDDAASASPPRSLLEIASALTTGAYDVSLHAAPLDMPAFPASLRFEFQVRVESFDPTPGAALILASLDFNNASQDRYSLIFTLFPAGNVLSLSLGEQSGLSDGGTSYVPHALPDALPLGQWTHVTLDVTYTDSATATAHVSFGGSTELAAQTLHPTAANVTQMIAGIGSTYGTVPSNGWRVRYDDVVLTAP